MYFLQYVSCFLDKSTEDEEEEPPSDTNFQGNDKCILSAAVLLNQQDELIMQWLPD